MFFDKDVQEEKTMNTMVANVHQTQATAYVLQRVSEEKHTKKTVKFSGNSCDFGVSRKKVSKSLIFREGTFSTEFPVHPSYIC